MANTIEQWPQPRQRGASGAEIPRKPSIPTLLRRRRCLPKEKKNLGVDSKDEHGKLAEPILHFAFPAPRWLKKQRGPVARRPPEISPRRANSRACLGMSDNPLGSDCGETWAPLALKPRAAISTPDGVAVTAPVLHFPGPLSIPIIIRAGRPKFSSHGGTGVARALVSTPIGMLSFTGFNRAKHR